MVTTRGWCSGAMAALVLLTLTGCPRPEPPPPPTPRAAATADEDLLPGAEREPIMVVVRQSCRTLDVYRYGKRIRSFPAVFGQGGTPKRYEGDRRTPVGLYSIVGKYPHPRWRYFFLLDYPNGSDVFHYEQALVAGELPDGAGIGGRIGIHGTDKPDMNRRGVDWTWGCISVDNDAIDDLERMLPVGTPVAIEP